MLLTRAKKQVGDCLPAFLVRVKGLGLVATPQSRGLISALLRSSVSAALTPHRGVIHSRFAFKSFLKKQTLLRESVFLACPKGFEPSTFRVGV